MAEILPLERHWRLLQIVMARRFGETVARLAEDLSVSEKTIRRDLTLLRKVGFPLRESVGDKGLKRWMLESGHAPPAAIRWDEAATLHLGRKLFEPLSGTFLADGLRSLFRKIEDILSEDARKYLDRMAQMWLVTQPAASNYALQGQLIDDLNLAVEEHRLVWLTYQSQSATEPVTYDVHPYGLILHRGTLYLVAFAPHHGEVRHYKVDRISAADVQPLKFPKPTEFDLAAHLAGSFGIYRGSANAHITVRVRFLAEAARYIQEKQWHASQKLAPQRDGSVIAEFQLTATEEIKAWVLSFGAKAEVLEPMALRVEVADELRQTLNSYQDRSVLVSTSRKRRTPK